MLILPYFRVKLAVILKRCRFMEEMFGVAVKAIIQYKGKVLILKRSEGASVNAFTWEFPGGGIHFGEELEYALSREVKEETGLAVSVGDILYATNCKFSETRHCVIIAYLCHAEEDAVSLSEEHTEYIWADKVQLQELLHKPILDDLDRACVWDKLGL
jgi:8-oxo-dGTP diphosphatase